MSGATSIKDIELIVEKGKGSGGGNPPPAGGNGGGDGNGNGNGGGKPGPNNKKPSPNIYYSGIAIGIVSILMFFMALASAFLVRKGTSGDWVAVHIPALLWFNTAILLSSSATLEVARKRLSKDDPAGFKKFWLVTTVLGIRFLMGEIVAW